MQYFQDRYNSRDVIYERKMFIRLPTGVQPNIFRFFQHDEINQSNSMPLSEVFNQFQLSTFMAFDPVRLLIQFVQIAQLVQIGQFVEITQFVQIGRFGIFLVMMVFSQDPYVAEPCFDHLLWPYPHRHDSVEENVKTRERCC